MATSGTYTFSVSADDLVLDAYKEMGVLEEGETPNASQSNDAYRKLTMLTKSLVTRGYALWAIQDVVLFPVVGAQYYALGDSASDAHWCALEDFNATTLTADALAGAGTIAVTSDDGIANADKIGIVLADGTIQWTTVNGAPAGDVVTLGSVLTGDASEGARVYSYTSRVIRPLRFAENSMFLRDADGNDTPITLISKSDHERQSNKGTPGQVVQACYQPLLGSGRLWTWPTAQDSNHTIHGTIERPLQDIVAVVDGAPVGATNPDFPIEWAEALYLNLALRLCNANGVSIEEMAKIEVMAKNALDDVSDWDRENTSVRIQPRRR